MLSRRQANLAPRLKPAKLFLLGTSGVRTAGEPARFRFPDELWARAVYDFALGYRYGVVHREHLLRSLVPLYLGRTAAFVGATRQADAAATEIALEAVGAAFEREKPYLVERW